MKWPSFQHEAMATTFAIVISGPSHSYAAQAAAAAFRELDRLENELSRYVETSDIARANRLEAGGTISLGDDALECLLLAERVSRATGWAFDVAYASGSVEPRSARDGLFVIDPPAHTLTARADRLYLDLGAVGKGYSLDRMAAMLADWDITAACLHCGGSTVLALAPPAELAGWSVGLGEGDHHRTLALTRAALSGSGIAVKGRHLIDPRTGVAAIRTSRVWALAPQAGLADALSTAFFVMTDDEIQAFCQAHAPIDAASTLATGKLAFHGTHLQDSGPIICERGLTLS